MSSTTASASTASPSYNAPQPNNGNQASSSLYLFTFLITILVLGAISAALLFRAYYVRRRFQRRVEEAIRAGQPLPTDAARALGLARPSRNPEKPLGPMPGWWEAEMRLDRDSQRAGPVPEKDWEGLVPLAIYENKVADPSTDAAPPAQSEWTIPEPQRRFFGLRSHPLPRPALPRNETGASVNAIKQTKPLFSVPPPGSEVSVGVLIALPFEQPAASGRDSSGAATADRWMLENEEDEAEVPEVCLGVMRSTIS